jgi:tetratricopeptide (TPR) repeat protein
MPGCKEAVESIVELALKRNYKRRISQIYTILGTYNFMIEGDYPKAFKYLIDALKIAGEVEDTVSLWVASHWIGHAYAENCEFDNALQHLEKALQINESAKILWGVSIMKSCIANTVYNNQGKADLGYQMSQEGLRLAEESGDLLSKAEAYAYYGCSCYLKGYLNDAEENLLKGVVFWERVAYMGVGAFACSRLTLIGESIKNPWIIMRKRFLY